MFASGSNSIESRIEKELSRRKKTLLLEQTRVGQVITANEDIKKINSLVSAGYNHRENMALLREREIEVEKENVRKQVEAQKLIETQKMLQEKEVLMETTQNLNKVSYKHTLQSQMSEKEMRRRQQQEKVAMEKRAVDAQIQKLIQEDLQRIESVKAKKESAFAIMQSSLADKERKKNEELERAKAEDQKFKEYMAKNDQRNNEIQEKKTQIEQGKNFLYEQIRAQKEKKLAEQREVENLKQELMLEEQREKERAARREQEAKQKRTREEMKKWEEDERILKERNKAEERAMEEHFKRFMQDEFEKKENLEQMNQQKRRMRELQHKRDIESLWQEKLRRFREEKEREIEEERRRRQQFEWEEEVVKNEKRRILETHLPHIQDTCTPSLWGLARTLSSS